MSKHGRGGNQRPNKGTVVVQQQRVEALVGPIPHPAILEGYNQIVPGAAERIIAMAEREQAHAHAVRELALRGEIDLKRGAQTIQTRGQRFAFILVFLALGIGGWLTWVGYEKVGLTVMGTTILAVLSAFLGARWIKPGASSE